MKTWADEIEAEIAKADSEALVVRELLAKIEKGAKDESVKEELAIARVKHEAEMEYQREILDQKLKYQKTLEVSQGAKPKHGTTLKLPKLTITKFSGNYSEWLPFWNTFVAEIDSADIPAESKFNYLKEWVVPKVRTEINGIPLSSEGYERAKNILKSEYGKSSEIVNSYVKNILALPIVSSANPAKVTSFYKTLMYNVQSLETLGKLERVNGMTRNVLDKLKGIKADLVRGQSGWQDWDLSRLVIAIKQWREINPVDDEPVNAKPVPLRHPEGKSRFLHADDRKRACVYCQAEDHSSRDCTRLASVDDRKRHLAQNKLCFNCTGSKHRAANCKSKLKCQKCDMKHHTSICERPSQDQLMTATCPSKTPLVYPVVVVYVEGIKCRALLDTGAGSSYASGLLLDRLSKREKRTEIRRIDMMLGAVTKRVELSTVNVKAVDGSLELKVDVTRVDKRELLLIDNPKYQQLIATYSHLEGLQMEDTDRKEQLPVHLILGASEFARIKTTERPRVGRPGEPVAEQTKFGWIILSPGNEIDCTNMMLAQTGKADYEELCRLDVLGLEDTPEHDQMTVYSEFKEQLVRHEEGWYETGLPWKGNHPPLPNYKAGSLRRLASLRNKLQRTGMDEAYSEIIEQQKNEGIVERADGPPLGREFYIPHKPVVREAAQSTKVRIVYDASAKAHPNAPSLNECLNAGPSLQNKLWGVLARSRFHTVAVTGDIQKAFLQIRIRDTERDALRFHWKKNEDSEIETLRFTRVLFGLAPSPFLLGGVIECHLDAWESAMPELVAELRRSLYVDDLISGRPTVNEALQLKHDAVTVFQDARLTLHKWHSNASEVEEGEQKTCDEQSFAKEQLGVVQGGETTLLGLKWNKTQDTIAVLIPPEKAAMTKRGVLRKLAKIYDPLGLVSPLVLQGKFIYRDLCNAKVAWDTPLPKQLQDNWLRWEKGLPTKVVVPRALAPVREAINEIELHGFGDASGKGVSATVHALVKQKSGVNVGLVAAKARLAKQGVTIPRLELISAHMVTNLLSNIRRELDAFPVTQSYGWLDSTVALQWINGGGDFKQFVANRVNKIQAHPEIIWRHVPTEENPADLGSRGGKVTGNQLWWNGPEWLSDKENWPPNLVTGPTPESEKEVKAIQQVFAGTVESVDPLDALLAKFCLSKAMRVCAWISRFTSNSRANKLKRDKIKGPLTTIEIRKQHAFWTKRVQADARRSKEFQNDCVQLNLQENHQGILECRGRIQGQFPVYLPDTALFTEKFVQDAHVSTLHGGVALTMAKVRETHWIPRLRKLVKRCRKRCWGCKRFNVSAFKTPPPGQLPTTRTEGQTPFQVVGVDFAGPIRYQSKGKVEKKAYLALYACSLTRGVYLELLPNLQTAEFLDSLKRLIARRGRPKLVYSDNGGTFVAAAKWLRKVVKDEGFHDFLSKHGIEWRFNLSRAPWWGGQFERLIGLFKASFHKVIGNGMLQWKELAEVVLDVEVALNNRPLHYVEDDIQLPLLTPNALLFMQPNLLPELEPHHIQEHDLRKRARYLNRCKDTLWSRWTREYVRSLREMHRSGGGKQECHPAIGDVVIIQGDVKDRNQWKQGIVTELITGRDGVVRGAKLRAGRATLERAVQHLYPLELSCDRPAQKPSAVLNANAPIFRPRRDAAVAAAIRLQEVDDAE